MATNRKSRQTGKPQDSRRQKPGSRGQGDYFHIEVRDGVEFEDFRTQDVGQKGHVQRVAGCQGSAPQAADPSGQDSGRPVRSQTARNHIIKPVEKS